MAKKTKKYRPHRRKHHAHSPRRRRRVGAMALNANSAIVKIGFAAAGYLFGDKLLAPIKTKIGDKVDAKIVAGVEGLGGYYLAMKKGKKSIVTTGIGFFLLGDAAKSLMKSFGIGSIGPYGRIPALGNRRTMRGVGPYGKIPVLGGASNTYNPHGSLNGQYNPHGSLSAKIMSGLGFA